MPPTASETLLEQTRRLIKDDTRNNAVLSRLTGLNYFWIRNFRTGKVMNPGVSSVETLHKFLTE